MTCNRRLIQPRREQAANPEGAITSIKRLDPLHHRPRFGRCFHRILTSPHGAGRVLELDYSDITKHFRSFARRTQCGLRSAYASIQCARCVRWLICTYVLCNATRTSAHHEAYQAAFRWRNPSACCGAPACSSQDMLAAHVAT
jgi:hypothetical protein